MATTASQDGPRDGPASPLADSLPGGAGRAIGAEPLRYREPQPSAGLACAGFVLCLLLAAGWETALSVSFLTSRTGHSLLAFLRGDAMQRMIRLPLNGREPPPPSAAPQLREWDDRDTRFLLALAAALAQHPDPGVVARAVSDLHRLAAADPRGIRDWLQEQQDEQRQRRRERRQQAAAARAARRRAAGR